MSTYVHCMQKHQGALYDMKNWIESDLGGQSPKQLCVTQFCPLTLVGDGPEFAGIISFCSVQPHMADFKLLLHELQNALGLNIGKGMTWPQQIPGKDTFSTSV